MQAAGPVDLIVNAVFKMAEARVGAMIVILGKDKIPPIIETGVPLHAVLSEELLLAIFNPKSPLCDGAAIVRGGQVVAAGCLLPIKPDPKRHGVSGLPLGNRHTTPTYITESHDCSVIHVSEETGTVSYNRGGRMKRRLTRESLQAILGEVEG